MCYKQSQHSLQLTLSKLQNWKLITNSNITACIQVTQTMINFI